MDTKEIQALQDLQKALLSINGAGRRLGISTNEVVIILPRHDFSYFKNVLESGNGSLAKFYIPYDFCCVNVYRRADPNLSWLWFF